MDLWEKFRVECVGRKLFLFCLRVCRLMVEGDRWGFNGFEGEISSHLIRVHGFALIIETLEKTESFSCFLV